MRVRANQVAELQAEYVTRAAAAANSIASFDPDGARALLRTHIGLVGDSTRLDCPSQAEPVLGPGLWMRLPEPRIQWANDGMTVRIVLE